LTEKGKEDALLLGGTLHDIEIHHAYSSEQVRTFETLVHLLESAQKTGVPKIQSAALNERDYGDYTGLNKWEVLDQLGKDVFTQIRRSWDYPIPNGETLEMVHERAVPFYKEHILPKLRSGENVLIVSHGNTIRSLIKYLEDISDAGISEVEMPFGHVLLYHVTDEGKQERKEVRTIMTEPTHA
jgi:2,3-bisphosphoglycerate-dependent phosphoglycerate mutase